MDFAVDYRETPFLETSNIGAISNRLNWRGELLLARNRALFEGKRVLDLASHDGRISYACLRLGARSVLGVEARSHLKESAIKNLESLEIDRGSFSFEVGDIFDWLPRFEPGQFDTILCFGFLYHTVRQVEFFERVAALRPAALILDTAVDRNLGQPFVEAIRLLKWLRPRHLRKSQRDELWQIVRAGREALVFGPEEISSDGATVHPSGYRAVPTRALIERLAEVHGFGYETIHWDRAGVADWSGLEDYKRRSRISLIARPKASRSD